MSVRQHTYTSPEIQVDRNNGDIPCHTATRSVANASYCLLLLSRSNGDAPVLMTARRWMIRGQAGFITRRSCSIEHSNARFFARFRFVEAHLVQSFSLLLKAGKVHK